MFASLVIYTTCVSRWVGLNRQWFLISQFMTPLDEINVSASCKGYISKQNVLFLLFMSVKLFTVRFQFMLSLSSILRLYWIIFPSHTHFFTSKPPSFLHLSGKSMFILFFVSCSQEPLGMWYMVFWMLSTVYITNKVNLFMFICCFPFTHPFGRNLYPKQFKVNSG